MLGDKRGKEFKEPKGNVVGPGSCGFERVQGTENCKGCKGLLAEASRVIVAGCFAGRRGIVFIGTNA